MALVVDVSTKGVGSEKALQVIVVIQQGAIARTTEKGREESEKSSKVEVPKCGHW